MNDAYAIALLVGMPVYLVLLLTRVGGSGDGELHWVRTLAAVLVAVAALTLLLDLQPSW